MKRHEFKNPVPVRERMAEKWKKRFMFEKGYSEECAEYMAQRLIDLIDHMQYGYALIAFHKQGNTEDNYISRFFVRGNVDMKLHKLITAQADANVTFYDSYSANVDWWGQAATLRPHLVSPLIPLSYIEDADKNSLNTVLNSNYIQDGKYFFGGTQQNPTNPVADAYAAGDNKFVSRQFQFNTRFDVNLSPLLKGLYFRAKYGIDYASTYDQGYSSAYATFSPVWSTYNGHDVISSITQYGKDEKSAVENINNSAYRYTYNVSGQFDYQNTFNEDHNVFAMVLANAWQTQRSGHYHRTTNANLGFQASYNYQHKYYADFSAAMPYSTKLPEGNRTAFSPTVTLGWNLAKEDFMGNSIFDNLMLTASAGIINQDLDITTSDNEDGYFLYQPVVQPGGWYSWGDNGGLSATEFQRGDGSAMTFVKRKEFTAGLRGSMWNRLLTFDFNFFTSKMEGGLARTSSLYPIYFTQVGYPSSSIIPYVNFNEDKRTGFDFSVYANKKVGEVDLTLGVSGMWYKSTAEKRDENVEFDYLSVVGRALNGHWGLQSEGFFNDQAEIDAAPKQTFGDVKPGDIRYKDVSGPEGKPDGVVDTYDRTVIGNPFPDFTYGFGLNAAYKGFDLSAFFQGVAGVDRIVMDYPTVSGNVTTAFLDRYSESANPNGNFPRLGNGDYNSQPSSFWLKDASYLRLKNIELGYSFKQEWIRKAKLERLRIYVSAQNILTITGIDDYDPEKYGTDTRGHAYPNAKTFSVGLNITL